jgi:hypothetical protein
MAVTEAASDPKAGTICRAEAAALVEAGDAVWITDDVRPLER